jgi:hemerythrin-like domain-containing protein
MFTRAEETVEIALQQAEEAAGNYEDIEIEDSLRERYKKAMEEVWRSMGALGSS